MGDKPWYTYLAFNVAPRIINRSEIHVHQHPEAAVFIRNQLNPTTSSSWVIVQIVGPFTTRALADAYAETWNQRTRKPISLALKGMVFGQRLEGLVNRHPVDDSQVQLRIQITAIPADDHCKQLKRRHSVYEIPRRPLSGLLEESSDVPPRPSQIQLHDVQQAWIRPDLFL